MISLLLAILVGALCAEEFHSRMREHPGFGEEPFTQTLAIWIGAIIGGGLFLLMKT